MAYQVRQLAAADLEAYREIRLEALATHPEAFGTTAAEEAAKPRERFLEVLEADAVFGGFVDGRLVGIAGLRQEPKEKERHRGLLWGMYVAEPARGSGLAGALVDAVLEEARGRVVQVHLDVGDYNLAARRLYESRGFVSYGLAPRTLKVGNRYIDEHAMVCRLDDD
jgi:GNAT superfamily N-acetyltransferase